MRGLVGRINSELKGVGDVRVNVTGDASKLKRDVEKATKTSPAVVKIDGDIADVKAKISETERGLADLKKKAAADTPQLDLDIREAQAKRDKLVADLDELRTKTVTPEVSLKTAQLEAQIGRLDGQLDALGAKKVTPELETDVASAEADLAGFRIILDDLTRKRTAEVDADTGAATGKLVAFKALAESLIGKITTKVDVDTKSAFAGISTLRGVLGSLAIPAGIAAATPYLFSLGASAVQAAGGLALLPAAGFAGALAVGGIKVATSGVGDALKSAFDPTKAKQFQKALAGLSPQARTTVLDVQGLGPALHGVKTAAQDALFSGLGPLTKGLASTYLPVAEERFVRIGGAVNYAATQFGGWLQGSTAVGLVKTAANGAASAFENVMFAVAPLGEAFLRIAAIGTPILAQLTAGAGGVAQRFATWTGSAAGVQTITGWIRNAITVIGQLWQLAVNVGAILGSMFGAASRSGESFLGMLVRVTGGIRAALATPSGADGVTGVFTAIRDVVGAFWAKLVQVWPLVAALGGALWGLYQSAAPILGVFTEIVVSALTPLAQLLGLIAPVLGPIVAAFLIWRSVVAGAALAQLAWNGALAAWNIVVGIGRTVMALWRGETTLMALAQAGLNTVMMANPIGLIIVAIIALVGVVIYAYQHFAWFRDIVQGAWSGIQAAASFCWSILQVVFSALGAALSAVGGFFVWLWQSVIVPAWNAIGAAISWAWTNVIKPVYDALDFGARLLGAIIFTVLVTPFYLAWQAISAVVSWAWTNVLQPIWYGAIVPALQLLGSVFTWLWQNVIVTAWNGIVVTIQFAWSIISAIWNGAIMPALRVLGSVFTWLWVNIIQPVWNGIVSAIRVAWDFISGIFETGKAAVRGVGDAFSSVADWIARTWATIKEAARAPIQFVVDIVYNNGIRRVWNGIAGLFGMTQLPEFHLATGGVLPGYRPGVDSIPTVLSPGEGVLVPEAVRGLGGPGFVGWANREFSGGRSSGGIGTPQGRGYSRGGIAHLADGGVLGGVGDFFGDIGGFFTKVFTDPVGAVKDLFSSVVGDAARTPGAGGWTDALKRVPGKVIDAVVGKVKEWVASIGSLGGGGGAGVQRWAGVSGAALGMMGQPQGLLPVVLRRMNQESGGNPTAVNRTDINWQKGTPSVGLMQVIGPTYRSNADRRRNVGPYLYGTSIDPLSNILASMHYALGRYGSLASAYNKAGGYDSGGVLPPGVSMAVNNTGGNEHLAVFTTEQWTTLGGLIGALGRLPDTMAGFVGDLGASLRVRVEALHAGLSTIMSAVSARFASTGGQIGSAAGSIGVAAQAISSAASAMTRAAAAPPPPPPPRPVSHAGMVQAEDGSWVPRSFYNDAGGLNTGAGMMLKNVIAPERVLSPRQTTAFESLVPMLSSIAGRGAAGRLDPAMFAAGGGRGPAVIQNVYPSARMDEGDLADAAKRRLDFATRLQG